MIVLKRLLITSICFLVFIPVFLMSSVSYSKYSNSDLVKLYFGCSKHPIEHFVAYYLPPTSAHINSSNYKNYEDWESYINLTVLPNGKGKFSNNKLLFIKMNNGRTYSSSGSLFCYAKDNKIYNSDNKLALYVKNSVLYDRNNNFIASLHNKLEPLTSFYNIQGAWLGLRADLSQENLLTYLAFYYNPVNDNDVTVQFKISEINNNYAIDTFYKYVTFYYLYDNYKLESPEITLGSKDGYSFYDEQNQLVGRYHPQTGLITNYKGVVIGKITKNGYVYGKTNNLLGRIGKFKYRKGNDNFIAKVYNASGKHIADLIKYYKETD